MSALRGLLALVICATALSASDLFAVVGGASCGEALRYGPQAVTPSGSADGIYPYFLSTNTAAGSAPHSEWLQIMTDTTNAEYLRIYWFFATSKTLSERFEGAVTRGETVDYRIELSGGGVYTYTGVTWRFSNGAGSMSSRFSTSSTTCCFSNDDAAWGGASGTVEGNGPVPGDFFGQGNFDGGDADCSKGYVDGRSVGTFKSYMHVGAGGFQPPTPEPSAAPTRLPTSPTAAPTRTPSRAPSVSPAPSVAPSLDPTVGELFAVVGGASCGEALGYGPQAVTPSGSADGIYPYFLSTNTAAGSAPHSEWLQIMTDTTNAEYLRIYWFFATSKTLSERFEGAVTRGETVTYYIELASGQLFKYAGNQWRFSSTAGSMTSRFSTSSTTCCFSNDDAAWGGASGTVEGNGPVPGDFFGQGNFNNGDADCSKGYVDGRSVGTFKSYMHVGAGGFQPPTPEPSAAPTRLPTSPTAAPTRTPSRAPSVSPAPSVAPSLDPTVGELFAVVGGASCGEALGYGPQAVTPSGSADGIYPYFLSTNTAAGSVPHSQWTQVVSDTSGTEYFRIYWTFRTSRTLSARFQGAVFVGETVDYRVVLTSGTVYTYTGVTWRFSNSAGSMTSRFSTGSTTCCFSSDDAAWGGGTGTVDGNGNVPGGFSGQGNFDGEDGGCSTVYQNGITRGFGRSLMYIDDYSTPPMAHPTPAPTAAPNPRTTAAPNPRTTAAPSAGVFVGELFAVVGGASCGEALSYGPQAVTPSGSADGLHEYFLSTNTAAGSVPHSEWLQIVSGIATNIEYLRIYWTFRTSRTLSARFEGAVTRGETVDYRIELSGGGVYTYTGVTWRFSNSAGSMTSRFSTGSTTCCFSDDDAAWGGASGTVEGNGNVPGDFFGQGNFDGGDSGCAAIYVSGSSVSLGYKSRMYAGSGVSTPTQQPTSAPTIATLSLQFTVSFVPEYVSAQVEAALLSAVRRILDSHSPTDDITKSVSEGGYGISYRDTDDPYYQHDLSPSYFIALDTGRLVKHSPYSNIGLLTDRVADIYEASVADGSFTQYLLDSGLPELQNCNVTSTSVYLFFAEPSFDSDSSGGSDSAGVIIAVCVCLGLVVIGLCGYAVVAMMARQSAHNTSPFSIGGAGTGGDAEQGRRRDVVSADDPNNFFALPQNIEPSAPPAPLSAQPTQPTAPMDPQWARAVVSSDDLGTILPAQAIFPCASSVLLTSDQVRVLPAVAENAKYDAY